MFSWKTTKEKHLEFALRTNKMLDIDLKYTLKNMRGIPKPYGFISFYSQSRTVDPRRVEGIEVHNLSVCDVLIVRGEKLFIGGKGKLNNLLFNSSLLYFFMSESELTELRVGYYEVYHRLTIVDGLISPCLGTSLTSFVLIVTTINLMTKKERRELPRELVRLALEINKG